MKRVKIFFGLLGITFFASVLFFYYRTDVFLESSYLQANMWGEDEGESVEQNIATFTNSCAGLRVELMSLGGQLNETRKKLDEMIVQAASISGKIDTLKKEQEIVLSTLNKIKEEKSAKESQIRKTSYTFTVIEKLTKDQKTQEDIWNRQNEEQAKQESELSKIQLTLGELRQEIGTFEKQIHTVSQEMMKCANEENK